MYLNPFMILNVTFFQPIIYMSLKHKSKDTKSSDERLRKC